MPGKEVHFIYYEMLKKEKPELSNINNFDIQNAIDSPKKYRTGYSKRHAHDNFHNFKKKYVEGINMTNNSYILSLKDEHALKFYFVNHLVVDMVQNKDKDNIPNANARWKRISDLGDPYNSYGKALLLRMGVLPEFIDKVDSKNLLLVDTLYHVDPNRIQFSEPLKTIIQDDYTIASRYRIENAEKYAKRLDLYKARYGRPPGFFVHRV